MTKSNKRIEKLEPIIEVIIMLIVGIYYVIFGISGSIYFYDIFNYSSSFIAKLILSGICCLLLSVLGLGLINIYSFICYVSGKRGKKIKQIINSLNSKALTVLLLSFFLVFGCTLFTLFNAALTDIEGGKGPIIALFSIMAILFVAAFVSVFDRKRR